ncbi:MAG: hypothetical protein ACOYMD_02285 [Paludibacter sp.]
MKRKNWILVSIILLIACYQYAEAEVTFRSQMYKNFNLGWDINKTDDYRWSNFSIGTAYGEKLITNPLVSWQIGLNYNWSKYTLYADGEYALSFNNEYLRTQSITIPATFEYKIFRSFFTGVKVYTGPVYELILTSKINGNHFPNLRNSQFGWTLGTKIRFLAIFNTKIAYNYYPTGLFNDGALNRSAISFSLGF